LFGAPAANQIPKRLPYYSVRLRPTKPQRPKPEAAVLFGAPAAAILFGAPAANQVPKTQAGGCNIIRCACGQPSPKDPIRRLQYYSVPLRLQYSVRLRLQYYSVRLRLQYYSVRLRLQYYSVRVRPSKSPSPKPEAAILFGRPSDKTQAGAAGGGRVEGWMVG
jgi:hypothetical protein